MKASAKTKLRAGFGRRFRAGGYSAFAAVLLIAIAVVANMLAGALPSDLTQLDLTASAIYSLSDQTKRIAASLDSDVTLYLLAASGGEDATISRLLERYGDLSDRIRVEDVDPVANPTFLDDYELDTAQLYANSVLVAGKERYRLVGYDEIYVSNYSMDEGGGYATTTDFDGESAITNAIHYVSSEDLPKVYALTGHGEAELSERLTAQIERDNLECDSLSLLSLESMPEDASALVINAPERDLSADEADLLIDWLGDGGSVLLTTSYISEGEMPNLLRVAEAMGLSAKQGLIIEGDAGMRLGRYPHYLLPTLEQHEITSPLEEAGYYVLSPISQPIEEIEGTEASVSWLLTTSPQAYAKAAGLDAETTEREDGDSDGPFHVAAVSELDGGKLAWFASGELLDDAVDMTVSGANGDLFLNALNWMCAQEEAISIRAKALDGARLTVTGAQSALWSAILVVILPLGLLAAGAIICIRRRRR